MGGAEKIIRVKIKKHLNFIGAFLLMRFEPVLANA